jgi:hypothetical protein
MRKTTNPLLIFHVILILFSFLILISCSDNDNGQGEINGIVRSGNQVIPNSNVTLFRSGTGNGISILGDDIADEEGNFSISFNLPSDENAVLYIIAENDPLNIAKTNQLSNSLNVRLALMLGRLPVVSNVVINERTTVAAAYAMAQFFVPGGIDGTYPGLQNAADISQNLADPSDGGIASMLGSFPNGISTQTLPIFNSLSNMLAACVNSDAGCIELFDLATSPGGDVPTNTLDAAVNIAHFPSQNLIELFALSEEQKVYSPALIEIEDITSWILALRYVGNGMELNGPGNIAFDKDGNAWIANNYVFELNPEDPEGNACGDTHVLKFTPTGQDAPGAPYEGGGLYGAGYGITLDPEGNVWVGNFGFQGTNCTKDFTELSKSVSKFTGEGIAISPDATEDDPGGFMGAGETINQPQGTVSDKDGNIWIANCNGRSITQFPGGDPDLAFEIKPVDETDTELLMRPFDIAIDINGNAWASSNGNNSLYQFDIEGNIINSLTGTEAEDAGINLPMGVATDSLGNAWVSNSGVITIACDGTDLPSLIDIIFLTLDPGFTGVNASVTMITPEGIPSDPFIGGGLLIPWGIAVDGNNNIWVSNFQGRRISQLCGADTSKCPPGLETGDPISPEGGYFFDGLSRSTAVEIDPSGNVWATNNWEIIAFPENPGGKEIVVYIGLAKPVKTPFIGPPEN